MKTIKFFLLLPVLFVLLFAGQPPKYEVGDRVADFKLKNVDGKMISLSSYKEEKGVIVIFDCNTCPYSKAYNDRIIGLNKKYASQGFPVVTINANDPEVSSGDSFDEMAAQAKRKNYDFPYLVDETQDVARAYGAQTTPTQPCGLRDEVLPPPSRTVPTGAKMPYEALWRVVLSATRIGVAVGSSAVPPGIAKCRPSATGLPRLSVRPAGLNPLSTNVFAVTDGQSEQVAAVVWKSTPAAPLCRNGAGPRWPAGRARRRGSGPRDRPHRARKPRAHRTR